MKPQRKLCCVLTVGFIVLFFWCVGIHWSNVICTRSTLYSLDFDVSGGEPKELKIQTPGNAHRSGMLNCYFGESEYFSQIGVVHFMQTLFHPVSNFLLSIPTDEYLSIDFSYDENARQILVRQKENRSDSWTQKTVGYIGPKGYSVAINPSIGAFERPLFVQHSYYTAKKPEMVSLFLYDAAYERFYRIDMTVQRTIINKRYCYPIALDSFQVIEGPVLKRPDWNPIKIDRWISGMHYTPNLNITWIPQRKIVREFKPQVADQYVGVDPNTMPDSSDTQETSYTLENAPRVDSVNKDIFIFHSSGRVDYLDGKTLNVTRCAGYLPKVGFYEKSVSQYPHDLADYNACGIYDPNGIYLGMGVAAISRDGTMMALDFYDAKGKLSVHKTMGDRYYPTDTTDYVSGIQLLKNTRNGIFLLTIRYLQENLQSPLLRLLDIPAAKWISPENRYNTMFVHPNSFIGLMKFDYTSLGFLLILIAPSLLISAWLAAKARKKASLLGYDSLSRDAWFIAVLAFGIPAYITFKLLLPTQRMVTCANCGNLRRVEFENCQSCKRDWQKTRDLTTAPDWCVRD